MLRQIGFGIGFVFGTVEGYASHSVSGFSVYFTEGRKRALVRVDLKQAAKVAADDKRKEAGV